MPLAERRCRGRRPVMVLEDAGAGAAERRRLLDAFVALVGAGGFRSLDADAVTARAGLAPEAFGRHFADLETCFEQAWDELEASFISRLRQAYESEHGWIDRFRAAATEGLRLVEAEPQAARFMSVDALTVGPRGRARQRLLGAHLAVLLDSAREELAEPDQVPAVTSRWILSIFFDRIYRRFATTAGPDLPSQLPELMFLAVSSYFGTEVGLAELDRGRSPDSE